MGPLQVQLLRVRLDLGVMVRKGHFQMQFSIIAGIFFGREGILLLCREYNQQILGPVCQADKKTLF